MQWLNKPPSPLVRPYSVYCVPLTVLIAVCPRDASGTADLIQARSERLTGGQVNAIPVCIPLMHTVPILSAHLDTHKTQRSCCVGVRGPPPPGASLQVLTPVGQYIRYTYTILMKKYYTWNFVVLHIKYCNRCRGQIGYQKI